MLMGSLFIWGNRALIGQLDKSVAGLGNSVLIDIDLVCSKARFMLLLLLSKDFDGMLQKLYACFHLPIALVMV